MASVYTYDQFEQEAKKAGLLGQFSQADLNLARQNADAGMSILKYKQDYASATTDEARELANLGAENIRSSYGNYTGGGDGGSFHLNTISPSSFQAQEAPRYENRYDDQTQQLINTILNRESFRYDPATDPVYQAYQKQYAREGQRATQDTLGAASLSTGGVPSSYAVTAATQAGDYYGAQMADKIPELYQQAYDKYLNEYNMKLSDLGMLQEAEQLDYNKFLNQLDQYNTDRSFGYAQYLDEIDSQTLERQEALEKAQLAGTYGDYSFLKDLGIDTSNNPTDWERQYQLAVLAAEMGDYSGLEKLGISGANNPTDRQWQYQVDADAYDRQYQLALLKAQYGDYSGLKELGVDLSALEAESGSSGGGYYTSGGSGGSDDGSLTQDAFVGLVSAYPDMVIPETAWNNYAAQYGETALTNEGFVKGTKSGSKNKTITDPANPNQTISLW